MLACPTLLQGHLQGSGGWKILPQEQLSNHSDWAARSPGTGVPWARALAGCVVRLFPWWLWLALWQWQPGLLPGTGMSLWDAVEE